MSQLHHRAHRRGRGRDHRRIDKLKSRLGKDDGEIASLRNEVYQLTSSVLPRIQSEVAGLKTQRQASVHLSWGLLPSTEGTCDLSICKIKWLLTEPNRITWLSFLPIHGPSSPCSLPFLTCVCPATCCSAFQCISVWCDVFHMSYACMSSAFWNHTNMCVFVLAATSSRRHYLAAACSMQIPVSTFLFHRVSGTWSFTVCPFTCSHLSARFQLLSVVDPANSWELWEDS